MTTRRIRQSVFGASILLHLAALTPFVFMTRAETTPATASINLTLTSAVAAPENPAQTAKPKPEPRPASPARKERAMKPVPATVTTTSQDAPPSCIRQELPAAESASAGTPQAAPAPQSGNYLSIVRSRIEAKKHYPPFARNLQQEGTVTVNVVIGADGAVVSTSLVKSSGFATLDKAALAAVRKAAPFPPPTGYGLGRISIDIPLLFRLI
ncbi:MAG: energy transducer TonB [Chlorobiaceae bacterium]|nr:energy transducer TonB [Chlorobiaceae bacterium]